MMIIKCSNTWLQSEDGKKKSNCCVQRNLVKSSGATCLTFVLCEHYEGYCVDASIIDRPNLPIPSRSSKLESGKLVLY